MIDLFMCPQYITSTQRQPELQTKSPLVALIGFVLLEKIEEKNVWR
jgi:hypothetical protein